MYRVSPVQPQAPLQKVEFQTKLTIFLLYAFYILDRYLVYVCIPLTAILALDRRIFFDRIYRALTTRSYLSGLTWALLISTMFGIAELIYGVLSGYQLTGALEILVFNFCPWILFLGIVAGMQRPLAVRNYIIFLAYFHAIGSPAYYLFLRHANFTIAGNQFGFQQGTGSLVLLGLFCYEKNLRRYWFPILVCGFDTIAGEMRADWVGLGIAITIWAVATKQLRRAVTMVGVLATLLAIGFIADIRLPPLPGRGGELSARDTVGRAISGIDPELAQEFSPDASTFAGTIQWRENWWRAIREEVYRRSTTTIFGFGYGYPIGQLVAALKNSDIRSPHNVFYFTLANSGLLGFAVFALLQVQLLRVLWRTFKQTGQIFGFVCAVFAIENSMLGNFFEAPQRALPTYILVGMCIGPLFLTGKQKTVADNELDGQRTLPPLPRRAVKDRPAKSAQEVSLGAPV